MVDIFSIAQLAVTRLQAIFGSFLLRRLKNSLLDGKRLIELPKKTVDLVKLEFSQEEREIYTMVSFYPLRYFMNV
jgi:SNF2 family DNA or RNA helicase